MIAREVLLAYPNFNKPFEIHTDASDYQLGSVKGMPGLVVRGCTVKGKVVGSRPHWRTMVTGLSIAPDVTPG